MKIMKLALVHAAVAHRQMDKNRQTLLVMIQRAAADGADYSVENRDAITPFVERLHGPTVTAVCELARKNVVFICFLGS